MERRAHFALTVFEKLATPVLSAVIAAQAGNAAPTRTDAETMASLLASSAELAVKLSAQQDFKGTEEEGDSFRLAASAVAARLIAHFFQTTGRNPQADDIQKITGCLDTAALFADKFVTAPDASARLSSVDDDLAAADGPQMALRYMSALSPAVNAIAAFSFGENEQTLVRHVAVMVIDQAGDICNTHFPGLSGLDRAQAQLSIIRALAALYAQAHGQETARIAASGTAADPAQAQAAVDARFASLAAIVATLAAHLNGTAGALSSSSGGMKPAVTAAPPPPVAPPAAAASGNPMSFFTKK